MSKNVAVFVDVANIFYAAKAAGVDIDYVTLLKSAIAGRDFVRAYAYTGLDPENENQRQFHQFLARSGYKVVSKDIRKYGDGKIKANLDIELVVDLMRTARNLDIAVIVSGDGDFAPAIRAVQQQGVRVEVISFRGNTSSDLIEVADVFTDIAQVARVERGSSRSGRRVAAEGDLSMTEVPDKETEGAPRRRRGGRGRTSDREVAARGRETAVAAMAESGGMPGNLIVLPGEKLSRASTSDADEAPDLEAVGDSDGSVPATADADGGRRRRRRRGGRGRGRGRGDAPLVAAGPGLEDEEDAADFDTPRLPPASTFGSVWDSQLGVPSAVPIAREAGQGAETDEEFEDEPEIPEYLLAERRQRASRGRPGGRPGPGGRGARAAYQSAVERERFGRGGGAGFGGATYGGPRRDDRRDDRSRRGSRPPRDRGGRAGEERQPVFRAAPGGDPWSEVPPELEELLRAQIAQKGSRPEGDDPSSPESEPRAGNGEEPAPQDAATRSTIDGRRTASRAGSSRAGTGTRTTRGGGTKRTTEAAAGDAEESATATEDADAAPKRRATRRKPAEAAGGDESKPATRRRTTRARAGTSSDAEQVDATGGDDS